MSSQPTLTKSIPLVEFLSYDGNFYFSRFAISYISQVNEHVAKGHAFIYVDEDDQHYCCELKDNIVDMYEYKLGENNPDNRKDGRRGLICKGKEIQQKIKDSIMWGKW